ncbi:TonB-dependent receptor [Inhella crocodyli]|uniref:TonB-dependent receptor n=1 Tax=Inhella crocodyli TaxID=2499851 RepID=A0A437LTP4_9BURK|nr:TonB-dependent receptor [Inhella crocodyli]RVT88780.1 TonB-dependent receptor [Inhella crocodyli]
MKKPTLPLGALAAGFGLSLGALAQTAPLPNATDKALPTVKAKAAKEPESKDSVQATETQIGKGKQELRDLPQSISVVTERLIDDRNLDTLKDALKQTAGISFLAAEGGEEDIRLRGFPLQATGDVFVDGMRDPAFYERDTFNYERMEVLRGSASMLFGRGSTGGAVNQVNKAPRLLDRSTVDVTVGSHGHVRAVGDFNLRVGESSAVRIGTMVTEADNNGAGSSLSKRGVAASWRTGIGERDEFQVTAYHLDNDNGMNYGMPFIRPTASAPVAATTLLPVDPSTYYGLASDRNAGSASTLTLAHTHRFSPQAEWVTKIRKGAYERDQRAGTVRFAAAALQPDRQTVTLATLNANSVINRGTQLKVQDMDNLFVQSDFNGSFQVAGMKHQVQAGFDVAREEKKVYAAISAAQGGVVPVKPTTTLGAPNDGASIDESLRTFRVGNAYVSTGWGAYLQDLVSITPTTKLLLGLRYDSLKGDYDAFTVPTNASSPVTTTRYRMKIGEWSYRTGLLFQPDPQWSFHLSAATSFNTSGDAYSLSAANVNIPPEEALNVEAGAKWDSADGRFSVRTAVFRATKLHERNTDPLLNIVTLSGKRHVAGFEIELAGKLSPAWDAFASYSWLPVAKIDVSSATGGEIAGDRPSLTPQHSGSVWTTYQLTPQWRVGGGLTARSGMQPIRNPGYYAKGWVTGDLMAEYKVSGAPLVFKANLSNFTNKLYADALYAGHYIPGAGRLFQVTGSYTF